MNNKVAFLIIIIFSGLLTFFILQNRKIKQENKDIKKQSQLPLIQERKTEILSVVQKQSSKKFIIAIVVLTLIIIILIIILIRIRTILTFEINKKVEINDLKSDIAIVKNELLFYKNMCSNLTTENDNLKIELANKK